MNDTLPGRISRERRGHLLLLGLDRVAKRNAFDPPMLDDPVAALGEYEADDRCAVLCSPTASTAGLDLANVGETFRQGLENPEGALSIPGAFGGRRPSKPLVVAVQGYCYTIGIELMLAADINLCASNARFAHRSQRAILPFGGATLRMHQVAGWGNATCAGCSPATEFDAHEAYPRLRCRKSPPGGPPRPRHRPRRTGRGPGAAGRARAPPSARRARPLLEAKAVAAAALPEAAGAARQRGRQGRPARSPGTPPGRFEGR